MQASHSLIVPTTDARLEHALREKLVLRHGDAGGLGEMAPLAIRLGLIQHTLKPRLVSPQLLLFAADHGVAVDGVSSAEYVDTAKLVDQLLSYRLPVCAFARCHEMALGVVDCGVATQVQLHPQLIARKIAHGTRNVRVTAAMSLDQAHAAIRAGMEMADVLPGNVVACAGFGLGSHESAALVLAALSGTPIRDLVLPGIALPPEQEQVLMMVLSTAQSRHGALHDVVEILAAWGGFEIAMMVGVMLVAASKRNVIMVDGLPACAALMVALRIAPSVLDYCVFARSHRHPGLTRALKLFRGFALQELGMDCIDGTGAALAWPLVRSAAWLITALAQGEESGLSLPTDLT
jgi:nicotinate-nucleotide--dimethylbenzimidazole phosphoribosyltransferase